jgi:hypothetical protein
MSNQTGTLRKTFVARAARLLGQSIHGQSVRVNRWRNGATDVMTVMVWKGDAAVARDRIGDVRRGAVSDPVCRQAICDWGGEHRVGLIEQRFAQVRRFACSSLGRETGRKPEKPFQGWGLLEPLCWILDT